jgi:hypothetical protein
VHAVEDYDAALRIDPMFAVALYARGQATLKQGNTASGKADVVAAQRLDPNVRRAFTAWGGWQRRMAEQAAGFDRELGHAIIYIAAGAVLVIVVLAEGWAGTLLPAAGVGALAGLLLGTGLPLQSPMVDLANALLVGFFLLGATMLTTILALVLSVVSSDTVNVAAMARLRRRGRQLLMPGCWPNAQPRLLSTTDLAKRIFVTVSAAAGGVVGSLATLHVFWENLAEVFTPQGVVATIVLTLVSVVLIRPLHEYVLDRGLRSASASEDGKDEWPSGIWASVSWRAAVRLLLVFLCLIQLDLMYSSLDFCIQRGSGEATYRVVFAGLLPAIVSYYWSAALQLGVRPLRQSVTLAAVTMGTIIWYPTTVTRLTAWILHVVSWEGGLTVAVVAMLVAMILAAGGAFLAYGLQYAAFAFGGAYAIDRARGAYVVLYVALALVVSTIVAEALFVAELLVTGETLKLPDYPYLSWHRFPDTAGWILGLFASSFPQLVRHVQTAELRHSIAIADPQPP